MLIAMTAVVVVGDQHRAAFATYSAVSVLPVNGTRVSSLSLSSLPARAVAENFALSTVDLLGETRSSVHGGRGRLLLV